MDPERTLWSLFLHFAQATVRFGKQTFFCLVVLPSLGGSLFLACTCSCCFCNIMTSATWKCTLFSYNNLVPFDGSWFWWEQSRWDSGRTSQMKSSYRTKAKTLSEVTLHFSCYGHSPYSQVRPLKQSPMARSFNYDSSPFFWAQLRSSISSYLALSGSKNCPSFKPRILEYTTS